MSLTDPEKKLDMSKIPTEDLGKTRNAKKDFYLKTPPKGMISVSNRLGSLVLTTSLED